MFKVMRQASKIAVLALAASFPSHMAMAQTTASTSDAVSDGESVVASDAVSDAGETVIASEPVTEPASEAESSRESVIEMDAEVSKDLNDYLWLNRPVVVFADTPNDPRFIAQLQFLEDGAAEMGERDVVIITDTDPLAKSELRKKLRPRGFQLVLIGKDGQVKLRKPLPWSVRELSRMIDKMPMRQQEMGR